MLEGRAERPGPLVAPDNPNRRAMIKKVRTIWITEFLKTPFRETRILLGLSERPNAVERPFGLLLRRQDQSERQVPSETQIVDLYDSMDNALPILGAPGSGKSTLLLTLCSDLLDREDRNPDHPIPVVFLLSAWSQSRKPLLEWLKDELSLRYDVPKKIADGWLSSNQILPLLDGLDEVRDNSRGECVEAINAFRHTHGFLLPLVVTSRTADYEALEDRSGCKGPSWFSH